MTHRNDAPTVITNPEVLARIRAEKAAMDAKYQAKRAERDAARLAAKAAR